MNSANPADAVEFRLVECIGARAQGGVQTLVIGGPVYTRSAGEGRHGRPRRGTFVQQICRPLHDLVYVRPTLLLCLFFKFLRVTAGTAIARLSHHNSVRPSVCLSIRHTGGSVKNGAS